MADSSPNAPLEIERKYLLNGVPRMPMVKEIWRIEQGYLPEPRSVDPQTQAMTGGRLRRITHDDSSVTCFHTIKSGIGMVRGEVEREISPEEFDHLWPATQGFRLTKTRYRVPEGDYLWEIDVFDGIDLFLAEIELDSADAQVSFPAWLKPHVLRDVTDDPAYTNASIAAKIGHAPPTKQ
jgi:adenylate cyclase